MIMLSTRASIFLCLLLLMYALGRTFAADEQVARFTQVEGEVTILSHPSKALPKNAGSGTAFLNSGEKKTLQ